MTDYDARLLQLYDTDNPDGPDHDFYRSIAERIGARSILDIGCGTGMLAVTLATGGRRVVGLDPSLAMLDYARARPGAAAVTWVHSDAKDLRMSNVDYAVMTGNVAQHLTGDDWPATLHGIRRAIRSGGVLAFESRNPAARAFETWAARPRATRHTDLGPLTEWTEIRDVGTDGSVRLAFHNVFERTGEQVIEDLTLIFRDLPTIERDLLEAGFNIETVSGAWSGRAFSAADPIMVFQTTAI
ncbi:MAG: class I SAM-dependent methyltransferase [Allobranchiibius sp.]